MKSWITYATSIGMLIVASAAHAQKVDVDSNTAANFSAYRTYGWIEGTPAPNPLVEQRMHASIEAQLAAKGLTKATGRADVFLATHVTGKEHQQLYVNGYGGWGYGFGGLTTASIETSVIGTLVVDMYDATTKMLVWRGVATKTVSSKSDKNSATVDKALAKMFKQYPPAAGSK